MKLSNNALWWALLAGMMTLTPVTQTTAQTATQVQEVTNPVTKKPHEEQNMTREEFVRHVKHVVEREKREFSGITPEEIEEIRKEVSQRPEIYQKLLHRYDGYQEYLTEESQATWQEMYDFFKQFSPDNNK